MEGKGKYVRVETMRLKNLGRIKSRRGLLSSSVVVRGSVVWKFQHHRFPIWYVIFVSQQYQRAFFLRFLKEYILIVVLKHVDYLFVKMKGSVKYVAHNLLGYQSYICIYSPILVNYYNILHKSPHFW